MTKSIYVCTPAYGGLLYSAHAQSVMALLSMARERGVEVQYHNTINNSLIPVARNICVQKFLETDFSHLMFIDADVEFQPHAVFDMLDLDLELVGGGYPRKNVNLDAVIDMYIRSKDRQRAKLAAYDQPINLPDMSCVVGIPGKACIQVRHLPTGFMMIERGVFAKVANLQSTSLPNNNNYGFVTDYFPVGYSRESDMALEDRVYQSEDFGFCDLAMSVGVQPYLYLKAVCHHWGTHRYEAFQYQAVVPEAA